MLGYFHSVDGEGDWLSALASVLDAATLVIALTNDRSSGTATLMHRAGSRTLARLCVLFDVPATSLAPPSDEDVQILRDRLSVAGYKLKEETKTNDAIAILHSDYAPRVAALAEHLGAEQAGSC